MAIMALIVYALSAGVAYLAGLFLPQGPWTPYAPLLIFYHVFLILLLIVDGINGEQKIGISLSIPLTAISHFAFLGALIGVVFMREYVPFFGLVRYILPGMAPFEAKWLFEGKKTAHVTVEPSHLPPGSTEDYVAFAEYMKQKHRRFARAGRSLQDEFVAWSADRAKQRAAAAAQQETT